MTKQLDQYKNVLDKLEDRCNKLEVEYKKVVSERDDFSRRYKQIAGIEQDVKI